MLNYWYQEDPKKNYYLQGNYAPIHKELNITHLEVEGTLPADLNGMYVRNGPNPMFPPITYTYPFDGDGMLHALTFNNGTVSYRNRWVETKGLIAEKKVGRAIYGGFKMPIPPDLKLIGADGDSGPVKNGAFIHIIQHNKKLIAFYESNIAYEVMQNLETIGPWCPRGAAIPFHVNAHTRFDPNTQTLFAFTYDFAQPYLKYFEINPNGEVTKTVPIVDSRPSMIHDFVVTKNYVIFFDCPALFDFQNPMKGILSWKPDLGVKIIIINRNTHAITILETETFFVYHLANGFEMDNEIMIDYVRYDKFYFGDETATAQPKLYSAIINLSNRTIKHVQCLDYVVEFPRINDNFNTCQHRFIFMPTVYKKQGEFNAVLKYDRIKQTTTIHDFGKNAEIGEAVFIPKQNADTEDDGYIGIYVYDIQTQKSEFVLLNAQKVEEKPVARIFMPQRVPHGLHGNWVDYPSRNR